MMQEIKNSRMGWVSLFACLWLLPSVSLAAEDSSLPLMYGIHPGPVEGFWKEVEEGAIDACKKYKCRVIYRGAPEVDKDAQRQIFNEAMAAGAKGIFIAPNDADRSKDVDAANAKHIPTVYFDRMIGKANIGTYIATDNYKAGVLAADMMIKAMGDKKDVKVAVLRMYAPVASVSDREKGFIDRIKKQPGYQLVADPYIGAAIEEGRKNAMLFFDSPAAAQTEVIFTPNETTAMATLLTLKLLNKTGSYKLVGFDSNPDMEQAIRDGIMIGMVVQQPYRMGYYSVEALNALQKPGAKLPSFTESGAMAVTKDTLATYKEEMHKIQ